MKNDLKQNQRLVLALVYILISAGFYYSQISLLSIAGSDIWLFSGILLIIFGMNFTEPYFAKPIDVLVNSITALLLLLNIQNKEVYFGYHFLIIYFWSLLISTTILIIFKDKDTKFIKFMYNLCTFLGRSKIVFSLIFVSTIFTFFFKIEYKIVFFISLIIWISISLLDIGSFVIMLYLDMMRFINEKVSVNIGEAIRFEDDRLVFANIKKSNISDNVLVGIVNDYGEKIYIGVLESMSGGLIGKIRKIRILHVDNKPVIIEKDEMKHHDLPNMFRNSPHTVILINNSEILKKYSAILKQYSESIGYIISGTDINKAYFYINNIRNDVKKLVTEGSIIEVEINGEQVLYQIINGITHNEQVGVNFESAYLKGIATKLGQYDPIRKELIHIKWVPNNYEEIRLNDAYSREVDYVKIAKASIGRLPNTDYEIEIKDYDSLVTHNTAILGILGIGKSSLTFEIVKKVVEKNIKVICIDITNQYQSSDGLLKYIRKDDIKVDMSDKGIKDIANQSARTGSQGNFSDWGNVELYKNTLKLEIDEFMSSDKKVFIINPEICEVNKAASTFKIEELTAVSTAEKTRYISESLLSYAKYQGQASSAKYLIVYEEAHSLIPEWNAAANGSDQQSANGTARVILQGRKYGLGCLITTQRTASVSKSILNQCNTIFALRIFDDTGKAFLENYIGSDYSSLLPTLEERHAIVMGKGLRLRRPVIIELNDFKYVKDIE